MKHLRPRIPLIILGFILLQPILDVLSYWLEVLGYANIVPTIRLVLFAAFFAVGYIVAPRKWTYWLLIGVAVIYWIIHCWVLLAGVGIADLYIDTAMYVRLIGALALVLALTTLLKEGGGAAKRALFQGCFINLFIIAIVVLLSYVTGSVNYAYEYTELGMVGWFSNDNGQGIILVAVVFFALLYAYLKKSAILCALVALLGFSLLFIHGSRVAYYSIFAIAIAYLAAALFSKKRSAWRYLSVVGFAVVAGVLYYQTPMHLNKEELRENNARVVRQTKEPGSILPPSTTRNDISEIKTSSPYERYAPDLVKRFGLERVASEYQYTTDLNVIRDHRQQKNIYTKLATEDSSLGQRLFGHEYADFTYDGVDLEPEADMVTIPFLYGIVGASIYWLTLAILIGYAFVQSIGRRIITPGVIVAFAAVAILIMAGLLGGHVAFRLNVSLYFAIALALLLSLASASKLRRPTGGRRVTK